MSGTVIWATPLTYTVVLEGAREGGGHGETISFSFCLQTLSVDVTASLVWWTVHT